MVVKTKTLLFYAAMIGGSIAVFLWIRSAGHSLLAPEMGGKFGQGALEDRVEILHHVLMELIVLNVGMDLGVPSPTLFAMLVIMAIVTTLATTPTLDTLKLAPQTATAG